MGLDEPQIVQICNGIIIDNSDGKVYKYADYSGELKGHIK